MSKYFLIIFTLVIVAKAQQGYPRENPVEQLAYRAGNQGQQGYPKENPAEQLAYKLGNARYEDGEGSSSTGDEIPGDAEKDYPIYAEVPETRFECSEQQFPGYYADPEARCQVFHICQIGGRKDSFLCPNGTIFNQEKLVCDWWFNSDCAQAQNFYSINEAVFRAMEEADRNAAEKKAAEGYRYNSPSESRYQQQRPSSSSSSFSPSSSSSATNVPQSDFDTVVVEAARATPGVQPFKQTQENREIFERQEMARGRQIVGGPYARESVNKNSQLTEATFGKQINSGIRDSEALFQDSPAREYLPAQIQGDLNNSKY